MSIEISDLVAPAARIRAGLIAPNIEALAFKEAEGRYNVIGSIEEMTVPHVYHRQNISLLQGINLGDIALDPHVRQEAEAIGRIGLTCLIRQFQRLALDFLDLKQRMVEINNEKEVLRAEAIRDKIRWTTDQLYAAGRDLWGEEWVNESTPSSACARMKLKSGSIETNLGAFPLLLLAVPAIIKIVVVLGSITIVSVTGLVAWKNWTQKELEAKKQALDACKDLPAEKCEEALDNARGKGPGEIIAEILKPIGISAGILLLAWGGWKVYEQSQKRKTS